jgi:hypothetical protein
MERIWIDNIEKFFEIILIVLFCFCLPVVGLELRAYTLSHSTSHFFLWWIFSRWVSRRTTCPGWLQTMILLISASWIARITGVSHQRLDTLECLYRLEGEEQEVRWDSVFKPESLGNSIFTPQRYSFKIRYGYSLSTKKTRGEWEHSSPPVIKGVSGRTHLFFLKGCPQTPMSLCPKVK